MPVLIVDAVVVEKEPGVLDVAVTEQFYTEQRKRFAKSVGAGVALQIRIEPADEAATWGDHKHYRGHLLEPVSEVTGYRVTELHQAFKAAYLPDGMTSTRQMNHAQFVEFNQMVEQDIRENYPEACWVACMAAMALSDKRKAS